MAIEAILDAVLKQAEAGVGSLMLAEPGSRDLQIVAARGFPGDIIEQVKKMRLSSGEGIAGHVYQTGKPYFLRDSSNDSLFVKRDLPMGFQNQFLSLPIANTGGRTIGVLNIHFPSQKILSSSELEDLHAMASKLVARELDTQFPLSN